jgi:hypothetical protein
MRIVPIVPVPAKQPPVRADAKHASPTTIVCAALALALCFLTLRIADALRTPLFPDCSSIADSVGVSCPGNQSERPVP